MRRITGNEKQKVIQEIVDGEVSLGDAAARLGLPEKLLRNWVDSRSTQRPVSNPTKELQASDSPPSKTNLKCFHGWGGRKFLKDGLWLKIKRKKETITVALGILILLSIFVLLPSAPENQESTQKVDTPQTTTEPQTTTAPPTTTEPPATPVEDVGELVYQTALKSTAFVSTEDGIGSGVLIDSQNKLLVTAYHVISDNNNIRVGFPIYDADGNTVASYDDYFKNTRLISAEVLRTEEAKDLAILRLATLPDTAREIKLSKNQARPGQTVFTLGNPGASQALWVFSSGSVRQNLEDFQIAYDNGQTVICKIVQTQNPTNPGDSGGPLLNRQGELVGITSGGNAEQNTDLVSYSIDIEEIKLLLSSVRNP